MNLPALTLIDPYMLRGIIADVSALVQDEDTAVSVTFTATGARTFNPKTGQADYAEVATPVSAWTSDCTQASTVLGAMPGDIQVLIVYADIAPPETNDRFVIASGDRAGHYAIRKATVGPLATHHLLFAFRTD